MSTVEGVGHDGAGREEGVELEAGRELDALVAEMVFGYRWLEVIAPTGGPFNFGRSYLLEPLDAAALLDQHSDKFKPGCVNPVIFGSHAERYSTDIAAAWEVVEKLATRWLHVDVCSTPDEHPHLYYCEIRAYPSSPSWPVCNWYGAADTAPLAICRAALDATTYLTNSETNAAAPENL